MAAEEYLGGTSGVSNIEYRERRKYLDYINESGIDFLDTLYNKKLYGFINKDYEIVIPVNNTKTFGEYSPEAYGLNYTVDIFNNFRNFYTDLITNTDIEAPSLIQALRPSKSYMDFDENYLSYARESSIRIVNALIADGNTTELPFSQFVELVQNKLISPDYMPVKVTKTGYALSPFANVHHTGLYIDLGSNFSPNLDSTKVELVTDPNFPCYAKYVQEFGFRIDFNCPWRIALDLDSNIVRENIVNGRDLSTFEDFYYSTLVVKTSGDDFWSLKTFYELSYVQYSTDIGLESIPEQFSTLRTREWVEVYLREKFRELGLLNPKMTNSELFQRTLVRALDIYDLYGIRSVNGAISYINKYSADTLRLIVEGR